jgi:ParB family chromosome partitioning protein
MTYPEIPLTQIDRNPGQPRKHFDTDLLAELAASIEANGLLEPIIVRPAGDRFIIIAGERRWRASQMAGLTVVPTRVMDLPEDDAFVLSVAENVNRSDMTVMEEAEAYAQLRRYGRTTEEIARLFGKRRDMIDARLTLLDLLPEIQRLVETGTVGARLAWHIAKLKAGNQRTVANRFARGELDETAACEFAAALLEAEQQVGFFDVEEPTQEDREEHVKRARKVRSTSDQIARIAELLSELGEVDPGDLADALGNGVGAQLEAMDRVGKLVGKARRNLRKAKAKAEARTLVVTEEAAS